MRRNARVFGAYFSGCRMSRCAAEAVLDDKSHRHSQRIHDAPDDGSQHIPSDGVKHRDREEHRKTFDDIKHQKHHRSRQCAFRRVFNDICDRYFPARSFEIYEIAGYPRSGKHGKHRAQYDPCGTPAVVIFFLQVIITFPGKDYSLYILS